MSFELLVLLNLVLLTRLSWLWVGDSPSFRRALLPGALLLVLIAGLFEINLRLAGLLVAVLLVSLGAAWLERHPTHTDIWRLLSALLLMMAACLFSPSENSLTLRPISVATFDVLAGLFPLLDLSLRISDRNAWLMLLGFLLLANETNLLVRVVFRYCQLTPGSSASAAIGASAFRAGRVIGFLERWLMYLVILGSDDLSALAFIIAAKGLARMRQLEEREFAEYMLIGTLMSALAALLIGLWVEMRLTA